MVIFVKTIFAKISLFALHFGPAVRKDANTIHTCTSIGKIPSSKICVYMKMCGADFSVFPAIVYKMLPLVYINENDNSDGDITTGKAEPSLTAV